MPVFLVPLVGLLVVGGIAAAITAAARRARLIRDNWQAAARQLGLAYEGSGWSPPRLDGSLGGLGIRVEVYSTGGKNKTYWTRYRATFPNPGYAVRLKRQTGLSRITKFFGAQDVEIGDTTFDDAFVIKEETGGDAAGYLTIPRRTLLLKLYSLYRGANLTPDYFEIVTRGYEADPTKVVTTTRRLVSAGRRLAGLGRDEDRVARSLQRRAAGDMAAAAAELHEMAPDEADVDTPMLEAEMLASSGRLAEAEPLLAELAERLPADEEVAGLRRAVQRMEPSRPAEVATAADMQDVLDDLFVSNRLSFETAEIFDEHYLGREVAWSGRVKSVRDYRSDLDFGSEPGTKLVVALAEVEHDLYGVAQIDAVVQLPPGSSRGFNRGDLVEFTGRLLKADSLMRNIYVTDGELR